jgi:AraC-like DNA-binding protein
LDLGCSIRHETHVGESILLFDIVKTGHERDPKSVHPPERASPHQGGAMVIFTSTTFSIAEVAERIGDGSASAFSVAFTRHIGLSPTLYMQGQMESRDP